MNTKYTSDYYMPNIGIGEKWMCKIKIYSDYTIEGDNLSVKKNATPSFNNVLKKDPVLFYKFSKLDFDQQQIVDFAKENGFLRLEHDSPIRLEPFQSWFEEIWYMKLAKELSDSAINKDEKNLSLFFKKKSNKHLLFRIPQHIINLDSHKTISDFSLIEKKLSRDYVFENQDLIEAADQIVSNIIQDRSEELVSFYIKAPNIKSKNAILGLDNLAAALWMQFMQYHLEVIKVKECEQCSSPFISPNREKLFCTNSCKLKFFRNPSNRSEIEKRKQTRERRNTEFNNLDYWKAIVLYGLNASTYKMGFGLSLINAAREDKNEISWKNLSRSFLANYETRLKTNPMPQLSNSSRRTEMEKITSTLQRGKIDRSQAIDQVGMNAFDDVVHRFHTIGMDKRMAKDMFYETHFGNKLILKDSLLSFSKQQLNELEEEILARWSLLEGAFEINKENFALANDIRDIYLVKGYERKNLTNNIPFLSGYQGNMCFYCGEQMSNVHVDHVLARQVLLHDEVWNLVLAHSDCNMLKSDRLVAEHYIIKLIARNENIMGSNHPWKKKIREALGNTPGERASSLREHYDKVKVVLGINNYWGGNADFRPDQDPFFRRLITKLNNR